MIKGMIYDAERLNWATLTLVDGTTVRGKSWGIIDAEDSDGNDLGYQWLVFMPDGYCNALFLREEDIETVEEYETLREAAQPAGQYADNPALAPAT